MEKFGSDFDIVVGTALGVDEFGFLDCTFDCDGMHDDEKMLS